MSAAAQTPRVQLKDLSYQAFAYPGDREALARIKAIPCATALFTKINEAGLDQYWQAQNLYNNVRVSAGNYPALHEMVLDCAAILDCPVPEVFIDYSPFYNGYTAGVRQTFVVLNSALVEDFSEPELRYIVGHELGHIKSGHVLYHSMGATLFRFYPLISNMFPGAALVYVPLAAAYFEWIRRSEFSADRAGALCVQDPQACYRALQRIAGRLRGPHEGDVDMQAVLAQLDDLQEVTSKLGRLLLFYTNIGRDHPYPVLRLRELQQWIESGAYHAALRGEYAVDPQGEHELGRRTRCAGCGKYANAKLLKCPSCGMTLEWF